jgi:hypothetical protein
MGPYRILYLAGRPNWEYKFLRRALDEDAELSLTSLIRIANREMKFSFRNSKMDSTNPLFSGFEDVSDDEKQQYDEPVYARLGVRNSGELQKGFPKDAEELFEYSALIIDDLEHQFLTLDQQQLIRQFIAVRGGALLALGGQESMRGPEFRDSVLGQILPLYGDSEPMTSGIPELFQEPPETLRFHLTREGWLQPPMRLSDDEASERKRLETMPEFQVFNRTSRLKPGASILVEGEVAMEHGFLSTFHSVSDAERRPPSCSVISGDGGSDTRVKIEALSTKLGGKWCVLRLRMSLNRSQSIHRSRMRICALLESLCMWLVQIFSRSITPRSKLPFNIPMEEK